MCVCGGGGGGGGASVFSLNCNPKTINHLKLNVLIFCRHTREFHNKIPPDKMPLLCRKFCVIYKPFTENIVYFCL